MRMHGSKKYQQSVVLKAACIAVLLAFGSIAAIPSAIAAPAPESFAPLVEKLTPAVVNIATAQKVKAGGGAGGPGLPFMFQFPDDPQFDPFRQFFEQYGGGMEGQEGPAAEREVTSLGSGFIIDPSGYVVTNNHVIEGADEVSVILQDDTKLSAKIVGHDPKTDLALLKVKSSKPLPYVTFGDSDAIRVGDWVVAIGNPFGLGGTVTAGIISARSRSINAGPFDDFLQTDAAINRGNSGGPLFNMNGEVVGISTAIFSPTGGNIGIGFAVPTALAKPVLMQLKEHGRTFRGWLGVKIQEVTDEIAESVGLDATKGALVLELSKDSPATKAGIEPGDVILTFDGKPVNEMRRLPRIVAETRVGKQVEVSYWRNSKVNKTQVTLGELDESEEEAGNVKKAVPDEQAKELASTSVLGMELVAVDAALRTRFKLAETVSGLLVLKIQPDSAASKQNITSGDVITKVNDRKITTLADFSAALEKLRKDGREYALVRVQRKSQSLFVTLPTKQ